MRAMALMLAGQMFHVTPGYKGYHTSGQDMLAVHLLFTPDLLSLHCTLWLRT